MRISHNLASLNIYRNYVKDLGSQSASLGRISSGTKINSAKDGAGALARSERLRIEIASMQMAARNSQDGISFVQTAEGGVNAISESLQRMRELVLSSSGSKSDSDKQVIQIELDQIKQAIDGLSNTTDFNGIKPLKDVNGKVLKMPVGANSGEVVEIPMYNLSSSNLKATFNGTTVKSVADINLTGSSPNTSIDDALTILDSAISKVNDVRSKYGAVSNRFESCYNDLNEFSDKLQGTESSIRDADIAEEMMNYTKDSLLVNASQAMLVQTNKFPQDILRILEGVRSR